MSTIRKSIMNSLPFRSRNNLLTALLEPDSNLETSALVSHAEAQAAEAHHDDNIVENGDDNNDNDVRYANHVGQ